MSRTIISVAGEVNYSRATGNSEKVELDTRKAIVYITPSGIKYGIIINIYRKNDDVVYEGAKLINDASNAIITSYDNGYATIKGKVQLKDGEANVGNPLDFTKTFAVENNVTEKVITIDSQAASKSSLGSSYKKITIYATVHF